MWVSYATQQNFPVNAMSMTSNTDLALSFPFSLSELDALLVDATNRFVHLGTLMLYAIQRRSELVLLIAQGFQLPPFNVQCMPFAIFCRALFGCEIFII
jgi:hypothetical protein